MARRGHRGVDITNTKQLILYYSYAYSKCTGNFRFVVRSIFAHAQISITTETLQPPWLTETQGDGWVSGTLGRDMAANPLQALIMHSLRMFISVHKGACADFGLTLQTTNLKFPVTRATCASPATAAAYAHMTRARIVCAPARGKDAHAFS